MKEVKEYLLSKADKRYQDFSFELNISRKYKSIGVRIPIIREYAKNLSKKYTIDYLISNINEEYYEEILLKGFIIGSYKNLTYDELIYYINGHLPKIKDWSMCDTFVTSLKIVKKYHDKLWNYLKELLKSKDEFTVRFALVMILNYYICDEYKDEIYKIIKNLKREEYYIKMANAWLLSYMFINYFDDTINFVNNNEIDRWTIQKGITKAIESLRISPDNKKILAKIREHFKNKD